MSSQRSCTLISRRRQSRDYHRQRLGSSSSRRPMSARDGPHCAITPSSTSTPGLRPPQSSQTLSCHSRVLILYLGTHITHLITNLAHHQPGSAHVNQGGFRLAALADRCLHDLFTFYRLCGTHRDNYCRVGVSFYTLYDATIK